MSQDIKDPEIIKKIESNSWKGVQNIDFVPTSPMAVYNKEWKDFLLEESIKSTCLNGKTVINVGGGHGEEAEFLIKKGAEKVLLVDIAPEQIKSAKIRKKDHKLHNLDVEVGDAENLACEDDEFDLGFICMALHHFPSHKKSITEICRVSGQVIFIDIMNSRLTKFLGIWGLFKEEWCGIEPNRLEKKLVTQIMRENYMKMKIKYFFYPPYSGNNIFLLKLIKLISRIINGIIGFRVIASIFGNVVIIKGKRLL